MLDSVAEDFRATGTKRIIAVLLPSTKLVRPGQAAKPSRRICLAIEKGRAKALPLKIILLQIHYGTRTCMQVRRGSNAPTAPSTPSGRRSQPPDDILAPASCARPRVLQDRRG